MIPLVERMDYLSAQSNSMAFCLSVEKLLGLEMPRARARHPRAARGAAAHQQPPGVARHARHGGRRRLGDALLLPRARAAAQHQRDARRLPAVPELHARRRPARGPAARLPRGGPRVPRSASGQARRVRGSAHEERDLPEAHRRASASSRRTTRSPTAWSVRSRAPPASTTTSARCFPYLGYETYDFAVPTRTDGRRLLALPGPRRRDAREREDLPPGARADHADRARSPSTIRASRRRPRTASTRRWKR